jgi:hypothetical protein
MKTDTSAEHRVLYHYFDFEAESQHHTAAAVTRNLLRQLVEYLDDLPQDLLSLFEKSLKTKIEPSIKAWTDSLCTLIDTSTSEVYIFLDGYDECPDRQGLNRLFKRLEQTPAKTYVAGRAPIDLEVKFITNIELEIVAPEDDLTRYLELSLEEDEELDDLLTEPLRTEVVTTLVKQADGVYVWQRVNWDTH